MRLKHVFALAPMLLFAVIAGAADTQLKEISVTAQGDATVVALETAGPFTLNEYRPQPSMVLVDLPPKYALPSIWEEPAKELTTVALLGACPVFPTVALPVIVINV